MSLQLILPSGWGWGGGGDFWSNSFITIPGWFTDGLSHPGSDSTTHNSPLSPPHCNHTSPLRIRQFPFLPPRLTKPPCTHVKPNSRMLLASQVSAPSCTLGDLCANASCSTSPLTVSRESASAMAERAAAAPLPVFRSPSLSTRSERQMSAERLWVAQGGGRGSEEDSHQQ